MSRLSKKEQENLPESAFAFPKQRKESLEDASHVRDALARFDQVESVTNEERDEACFSRRPSRFPSRPLSTLKTWNV